MSIERTKSGKIRYTQKVRIYGRVKTKHLGFGEAGRLAHESLVAKRTRFEALRSNDISLDAKYDHLEQIANQIAEQHFAVNGLIKRQCLWKVIERLNKPLSTEEEGTICESIAAAIPCTYTCPVPYQIVDLTKTARTTI